MIRRSVIVLLAIGASGCSCGTLATSRLSDGGAGGDAGAKGGADAGGAGDGGVIRTGTDGGLDGGAPLDAGSSDAGLDAGISDAGLADAGAPDGGIQDAGLADAGSADAGAGDAGVADAGSSRDGGAAGPCTPQNGGCLGSASCCQGLVCTAAGGAGGTFCEPNVASGCGLNSTSCNGACVVTLTDPNNCGGCGIRCDVAAGFVCTGGACLGPAACPQGLTACAGSCVDFQTSNANCGACGSPCPAGQGCAAGSCVQTVALLDGGPACTGGGPPVDVGDAGICTGALAQVTFRWALCSCGDVSPGSPLVTDAFDSTFGPYQDGGLGGSVGVNGNFGTGDLFDFKGTAWVAGDGGMSFGSSGNRVWSDLLLAGPLQNGGDLWVGGNAWLVGGASGTTSIDGTIYTPSASLVGAGVQADGGVVVGPVTVPPPCDCSVSQLIDVAGIVQDGALHNDDATIGLNPDAVNSNGSGYGGANRLDLPCGRYYLSAIHAGSAITIAVHGRAAIFVGGDIRMGSPLSVTIDPQAELDLFVGGTIDSGADISFGSTEVPAQSRIYVAGSSMSLGGSNLVIAGNFYLPNAAFSNGNPMTLYGSMFTGSYGGGPLTVHYDTAVLSAGQECAVNAPDGGAVACSSCRDCGNQACVNGSCGACRSRLDCCSPYICSPSGRCIPPG